MATGRNEPCPCGSGRKFKVCCLPLGRRLAASEDDREPAGLPARFREGVAIALAGGADAATAEVRAAVGLAGSVCFEPPAEDDPELEPFHQAFLAVNELVAATGGDEGDLVETFLPRLPFDVVLDDEGRTVADLILARHGASLPPAAGEALRALVEAEDAICRFERADGRLFVEDVRTGRMLPAAEAFRSDGPGVICRLVSYRGRHVPLDAAIVDDPRDPWYGKDFEVAVAAAAELCAKLGLRLRTRAKGASIGFELLDLAFSKGGKGEPRRAKDRNAEGHEIAFTTLRWDVAWEAGARESLARLDGLELEETPQGLTGRFRKTQPAKARKSPGETLTVGTLRLEGAALIVETDSLPRAERLRKKLDKALGKTATLRSVASDPRDGAPEPPVDPE